MLSRYADVLAGLQERRLWPVDSRADDVPTPPELHAKSRSRAGILRALSGQQTKSHQAQFQQLAQSTIASLNSSSSIDIVQRFAEPWCLAVSVIVIGANEDDQERLNDLAREVSAAAADPSNEALREPAKAASKELATMLQFSPIPMSGAAFVGLSQTLPRFLANAWLALLRDPEERERLRGDTSLMPLAIEELLRYSGPAHTVIRRASATLDLAGIRIAEKEKVILKLSSANRDPEQFPEPDRLDLSRRAVSQLGLGAASHSCAAASIIKILAGIATNIFVENVKAWDETMPVEWQGGSGFRSPKSLYVFLRQ